MVAILPIPTFTNLVIFTNILATVFGSVLEKRVLPDHDSPFVGDASQPGVWSVKMDDRGLAHKNNIARRPVKIQVWCSPQGPNAIQPWYNVRNGEAEPATHYTWGQNPPTGIYSELKIEWNNEYINQVTVGSCGPEGHRRICLLYISKMTRDGNTVPDNWITCGDNNNDGKLHCAAFTSQQMH